MPAVTLPAGGSQPTNPSTDTRTHDEFFIASFWKYRPEGITHILKRAKLIGHTQYDITYDPRQQWFKVVCLREHASAIQDGLATLLRSVDGSLPWESILDEDGEPTSELEHPWVECLRDCSARPADTLPCKQAEQNAQPARRIELPDSAKHCDFVRIWSEIDDNEDESVELATILPAESRLEFERSACVSLKVIGLGRVVYVGGDTEASVDRAIQRLSCLLRQSHQKPLQTIHLIYAEGNRMFGVDARHMAAINPVLVTSSFLDPKIGPTMAEQYRAIATSASLRITLPRPVSGSVSSLFGPRLPACFKLQEARRYCQPFDDWTFKAKQKRTEPIIKPSGVGSKTYSKYRPPSHGGANQDAPIDVGAWIRSVPDQRAEPPPVIPLSNSSHEPVSRRIVSAGVPPSHPKPKTTMDAHEGLSLADRMRLQAVQDEQQRLSHAAPHPVKIAATRPSSFGRGSTSMASVAKRCAVEASSSPWIPTRPRLGNCLPTGVEETPGISAPFPDAGVGSRSRAPGVGDTNETIHLPTAAKLSAVGPMRPGQHNDMVIGAGLTASNVLGPPILSDDSTNGRRWTGPRDSTLWPGLPSSGRLGVQASTSVRGSTPQSDADLVQQPLKAPLGPAVSSWAPDGPTRHQPSLPLESWPPTESPRIDSSIDFPSLVKPDPAPTATGPGGLETFGPPQLLSTADYNKSGVSKTSSSTHPRGPSDQAGSHEISLLDHSPLDGSGEVLFEMEALVPMKPTGITRPTVRQNDDRSGRVFFETMNQKASFRKRFLKAKPSGETKPDPDPAFAEDLAYRMAQLAECLRSKPGRVTLNIVFGRICLKDFTPTGLAVNNRNQEANSWRPQDLLERMNKAYGSPESFVFIDILSPYGQDADALRGQPGDVHWTLHSRRVLYEFTCEAEDTESRIRDFPKRFVVEIDASDFSVALYCPDRRLAPIAVHCVHRHWDFEVVATHSPTTRLLAMYSWFAHELVDSLEIPPNTRRSPTMYYEIDSTTASGGGDIGKLRVGGVRVRYVARHTSKDGATYLDITQVQDMTTVSRGKQGGRERFHSFPAKDCTEEGRAAVWFQASLASLKAEELFKANEALEIGEESSWTTGSLEKSGSFEALWKPALAMIKGMDAIGVLGKNGLTVNDEEEPNKPQRQPGGLDGFW